MKGFSAVALLLTIAASVAVMWSTAKWATTIPEVSVCGLAGVWAVAFSLGRGKARLSYVLIPLSAILLLVAVQLLFGLTIYPFQTWKSLLYWAGNGAAFFVGLQVFGDRQRRDWFLRALLIFGFLAALVSSLQALTAEPKVLWLFPSEFPNSFLMGPFVYRNQYAAFIELLMPIALFQLLIDRRRRAVYIVMAAGMYASVIVSASRTGFVLCTAELLVVPALMLGRRTVAPRQLMAAAAALTGTVLLFGLAAGPDVLAERFMQKDPYIIRREFVYSSLAMIKDHPLKGVGLGNWSTAYPAYATFDDGLFANQAHNDWAQWTVEGGIPLLLIMLSVGVWAVRAGYRTGWAAGLTAVFFHCIVDYPIQRAAVSTIFFVLLAAAEQGEISGENRLGSDSPVRYTA